MSLVTKEVLSKMKINLPELATQERIGTVLELWKREQVLLEQLWKKRALLINQICLANTHDKGR